jgi:endonuclease/exonuclease/phosphatase family metal-dependent hydrolase
MARERRLQVDALLGEEWLNHPKCHSPFILLGDFNAMPGSRSYRRLAYLLSDAQRSRPRGRRLPTFPSHFPVLRLDHIFLSSGFEIVHIDVPRTALTLVASDHLPVVADLSFSSIAAA